jgi:uncharacterized protein (DUF58 family)
MNGHWRVSASGASTAVVALCLIILGLLSGRADVAVLGAPLLISFVWTYTRRPKAAQPAQRGPIVHQHDSGELVADLELESDGPAGIARIRVSATGYRTTDIVVAVDKPRTLVLSVQTAKTGRHEVFRVDYVIASEDDVLHTDPRTDPLASVLVLPSTRALKALPLPFRLQGLTGSHSARRPGDGGDLHDVNLFAAGDRLRRIDWRVTARRSGQGMGQKPGQLSELYVRRTFATADATVFLIVDSRDEVGPDVASWGNWGELRPDESTSLDIARHAAASLARHYLAAGDRVGLEDLGEQRRPIAPAGGNSHLQRLLHQLALARPVGEPRPYKRPPHIPSGALIIVFSTFLDDEAARMAALWRHSGHRVLAVDVLPALMTGHLSPTELTAYRIVRMERIDRIDELSRSGVEVVHWEGSADSSAATTDVDVAFTALTRRRSARR